MEVVPEEDAEVDNAKWFELEEKAQNMGTLCMLEKTFSGKHQLQLQHWVVDQEDKPLDQIPVPGPTKSSHKILSHKSDS